MLPWQKARMAVEVVAVLLPTKILSPPGIVCVGVCVYLYMVLWMAQVPA